MDQLSAGQQAEIFRAEKISSIQDYVKEDPTVIFEIAETGGFTPHQAIFILQNGSAPISNVLSLYNAMLNVKNKKDSESIMAMLAKQQEQGKKF